MPLDGFRESAFSFEGKTRTVYCRGTGPGVVIMHELPGITPEMAGFGRRVADAGLTAVLPDLFGTPGKPLSTGYFVGQLLRVCVSREFACLAKWRSSPITDWLRALCRQVHHECGGPGVGAVGMCMTGGFVLSLMLEPSVLAPVVCHPSLPLFPITRARKRALPVSPEELVTVRQRCAAGVSVLGLRFTHDALCPRERFETLRNELGEAFEIVEIDSSPSNAHGIPLNAHCVLTVHFVDSDGHPTRHALDRVLTTLKNRLQNSELKGNANFDS